MKRINVLTLIFASVAVFFLCTGQVGAADTIVDDYRMDSEVKEGNRHYHEGKYDRARASYTRAKDHAKEESEENFRLHYNLGNTFYKEGNYQKAQKEFQQALRCSDDDMREKAHYNLGNTYFKQGRKTGEVKLLEKAVEQYRKTLEINPENKKAKHNIEVVRRTLDLERKKEDSCCDNQKKSDERQKKDPQKSGDNQKQSSQSGDRQPSQQEKEKQARPQQTDEDGQKNKPKPDKKKKDDGQKKKDASSKFEEEKEDKPKQIPGPAGGDTVRPAADNDKQVTPSGSKEDKGEMSREKALQLLQAVEKREKEDMKKVMESRRRQSGKAKDW